jgi:hypothetical protein
MNKIHIYQEKIFDISVYITYGLIILSSLGFSQLAPKYLDILDYYIKVYICLFLMWRFNPFRTHYEFTELDRKIAFSAGAFILTTTVLNQYLSSIKNKATKLVESKKNDFLEEN